MMTNHTEITCRDDGAIVTGNKMKVEFSVDGALLRIAIRRGNREGKIFLHDTIARGGVTYALFHAKTRFFADGGAIAVRCSGVSMADGAPLSGLVITYRFLFSDAGEICITTDVGSDLALRGCSFRWLEISHEGFEFDTVTGFEHAPDGPFSRSYPIEIPGMEKISYEESLKLTYHTLLEMKGAQPLAFREAIALSGKEDYLALVSGNPTWTPITRFLSAHPELIKMEGDLRFFSEGNPLRAHLLLEKPADMFAAMASLASPQAQPVAPRHDAEEEILLEAGRMSVRLARTNGGLWLCGVGENEQPGGMFPLFHLNLWDTQREKLIELDSGEGWEGIDLLQGRSFLRCSLRDPGNGDCPGIAVTVEAALYPEMNRIEWKCTAINTSDRFSVQSLSYPNFIWGGEMDALIPSNAGVVIPSFTDSARSYLGIYPCGCNSPMAFGAFYKNGHGIYVGVHDPDGSYKKSFVASAPVAHQAMLTWDCPAVNVRRAGNSFTLPGKMIWQAFSGDWFDATKIYRDFVHGQAKWLSSLRGRPDSPQWLRTAPMWITSFMSNDNPDANPVPITLRPAKTDPDPDAWYKQAIRLREVLGVPLAYHVYNWHWVPFNNDNPHYFPTKPNFRKGVRALHEADIKVVPYMAAYSWDMHDHRGDDDRYLTEAEPNTAKDENGGVIHKSYASTEPNGVSVAFARMCPTTAFWKREVRRVVRRLYHDYEVDGIYLDVVSAQTNHCCDPEHNHVPGYGHTWGDAYRELMKGLRLGAPSEFALTSESCAEVYTGDLDGMLSWQWNHVDLVPAFSQIYCGYVALFGRNMSYNKRDDIPYFKFHIAQSLLYGQQIGWIHPEIVDDERRLPFLKKIVGVRWNFRDFFTEAVMLRPPVIAGSNAVFHSEPALRETMMTHEGRVGAAGWEDASGKRILFAINTSETKQKITLTVPLAEYGALAADQSVSLPGEGRILPGRISGESIEWEAELEPDGCVAMEWQK